jgi:hypothetical protein
MKISNRGVIDQNIIENLDGKFYEFSTNPYVLSQIESKKIVFKPSTLENLSILNISINPETPKMSRLLQNISAWMEYIIYQHSFSLYHFYIPEFSPENITYILDYA